MQRPRVIVIGAGIGGLTGALELAHHEVDVCVFEACSEVGGKLRQVVFDGNPGIDSGPTVFTMRWVFDDLFDRLGLSLDDHLQLEPLHLLARHSWSAGGQLDLFADEDDSADAIGKLSGADEAQRYRRFCSTARRVFDTLEPTFMCATRPNVGQLVARIAKRNFSGLTEIHPFRTLWNELGRHFRDPRLRQLFGRYSTYCGSSPFEAPGTLALIAHAEQRGVWLVRGGMRQVAIAFAELAKSRGAEIRCNTPVSEIIVEHGRATGVRLASGERMHADAVLFNGDVNALASGRLGAGAALSSLRIRDGQRSQSAVTWSMIASASGYDLAPHTVFFSDNYRAEFDDVFKHRRMPCSPTVYVHAPDRPAAGSPVQGQPERIFCLVNAPATGDCGTPHPPQELDECQENMLRLLKRCGLSLHWQPHHMQRMAPSDFERLFPATGGALYGRACHGWRSSFQRPGSRTRLDGLYLAGGSVHPGPGVPMATLSGRLAASSLVTDFRSRRRFVPAGTIGGTSTA